MKPTHLKRFAVCGALFAASMLAATHELAADEGSTNRLERLWTLKNREFDPPTILNHSARMSALKRVFTEASENEREAQYQRLVSDPRSYSECSEYERFAVRFFMQQWLELKNRDKLAALLVSKYPAESERDLAVSEMDGAFELLFYVYENARNAGTKRDSLDSLRHAFASSYRHISHLKDSKHDQMFVTACKKWYQENQSRIQVNHYYFNGAQGIIPPPGQSSDLFIAKPSKPTR